MKSQQVRLVDVFVLGPFLAWAGWEDSALPNWARFALFLSGVATIWYNGRNYIAIEKTKGLTDSMGALPSSSQST